jgi:hypothetical protein
MGTISMLNETTILVHMKEPYIIVLDPTLRE